MTDNLKKIDPALTAEEWKTRWVYAHTEPDQSGGVHVHPHANDPSGVCVATLSNTACVFDSRTKHALAALCLYGTPEGFTREDVELLRFVSVSLSGTSIAQDSEEARLATELYRYFGSLAGSLAARLAALLPPEDVTL